MESTKVPNHRSDMRNRLAPRPGHRTLGLLLVLSCIIPASTAAQDSSSLYRELALRLVQRSLELSGEDTQARRDLLERARSLDPGLGDSAALLADFVEGQRDTSRREALLRAALAADLILVERDATELQLARLLVDTARPSEALRRLGPVLTREGQEPLDSIRARFREGSAPRLRPDELLYIEALVQTGGRWLVGDLMEELRQRFPDDLRLAELDWGREPGLTLTQLEWMVSREHIGTVPPPPVYRDLILALAPRRDTGGAVVATALSTLHDRYRAAGGQDPLADLVADPEPLALMERDTLQRDKLAWELLAAMGFTDGGADDADVISSTVDLDVDRDGRWEQRYILDSGQLVTWLHDPDEDGMVSAAVHHDDTGTRVYRAEGNLVTVFHYSSYPQLDEVVWARGPLIHRWRPPRPVPFELGNVGLGTSGWNLLTGRVTVDEEMLTRFARQRRGPGSVLLAPDEALSIRSELEDLWLVQ